MKDIKKGNLSNLNRQKNGKKEKKRKEGGHM